MGERGASPSVGFLKVLSALGWVAYCDYGSGVVRLGVGNNRELGGEVRGPYFRWRDLLLDATVTFDGVQWLVDGRFVQ